MEKAINKIIYLPVQIKQRAFLAKLLLGYLSLQHDYSFVIGRRKSVKQIALKGPDGIYLEKDFFGKKSEYFEKFKERNMIFYGLDDEGLVFQNDQEYLNRRVDYESIKYMKKVFTWGERQANILKNFLIDRKEDKKVIIAGNPRIDLLSEIGRNIYKNEIKYINNHYGKFILFNSFFALANGIKPIESQLKRLKRMKKNISEDILQYWLNFYNYQKELFSLIVKALQLLATDISTNLVIRPHPNEKITTWKKLFKDYKNVKVIKRYDIFPWIYCADAVIHNSCTTGIEAYLLGKKVIAYKPVTSENFELKLPNSLSIEVNNINSLKDIITKIIQNKYKETPDEIKKKRNILNYNLYTGKKLSSELLLEEFNKNIFNKNKCIVKKDYSGLIVSQFLKYLHFINNIFKLPIKNPHIINDFPPTSVKEVRRYIDNLNEYFKLNFNIKIKQVSASCFYVYKT